jgi:hypothetical protein
MIERYRERYDYLPQTLAADTPTATTNCCNGSMGAASRRTSG